MGAVIFDVSDGNERSTIFNLEEVFVPENRGTVTDKLPINLLTDFALQIIL